MGLQAHVHSEGKQQTYALVSLAATHSATSNEVFARPVMLTQPPSAAPSAHGGQGVEGGLSSGRREAGETSSPSL